MSAHEAVAAQEAVCVAVLINGAGHEAAAAFAEATPLHDDCFLLPLPTLSPSLPRLLAADAAATAAATSAVAPAAAVPPAAVDVGAGVSGAMARLALWQGTPLTPSPTEPCAGAAREGAASLSLLPEDLASLVMARLLDEDVRAACVLAAASRALRRLQRAAWLDAPCLHLAGAAGADVPFYEGKVATARYFFKHELVKTRAQADLLASFETSTLDMAPGYF